MSDTMRLQFPVLSIHRPDKDWQYSHSLRHWLRKSPYIRIARISVYLCVALKQRMCVHIHESMSLCGRTSKCVCVRINCLYVVFSACVSTFSAAFITSSFLDSCASNVDKQQKWCWKWRNGEGHSDMFRKCWTWNNKRSYKLNVPFF